MDIDVINAQLSKIEEILNTDLVPAHVNAVYPYRAMPSKLPFVISISFLGGFPGSGTVAAFDMHSDFAVVMEAHHDKTDVKLQWAEQKLNEVEMLIVNTFQTTNYDVDGLWMSAEFYKPSGRPPSPSMYTDARLGHLYLRLNF